MTEGPQQAGRLVHAAVAELYAVAPADFVARRTALVKGARAAGDRDAAAQIGALRKPSVSAWALNQVVRSGDDVVDRLRELGVRLRHAQSTLDGAALVALRGERDEVLDAVVQAAASVSVQAGQALTVTGQAEVRDTGIGALADAFAEEVALSGALTRALSYSGFGEVDVSDAVARTSTGVILARLEGGRGDEPADQVTGELADETAEEDAAAQPTVEQAAAEQSRAEAALAAAEHELASRHIQLEQARTRSESTRARVEQLRADLERAQADDEAALEAVTAATQACRTAEAARQAAAAYLAELRASVEG